MNMIEAGVQIVNPVQSCNDRKAMAKSYKGNLSFDVSIDAKAGFEETTEEELRADVRETIDIFGSGKNVMLSAFCLD